MDNTKNQGDIVQPLVHHVSAVEPRAVISTDRSIVVRLRRVRRKLMRDVWTIGPTAAAHALRAFGFSPRQAERLVALKIRYQRGAFRELSTAQKRLLFARWLVEHNRLSDG